MMRWLLRVRLAAQCAFGAGLLAAAGMVAAADTVVFPAPEDPVDERGDYQFALLRLALEKSRAEVRLERGTVAMGQRRALAQLAQNDGSIHVLASMTSVERELLLRPVRIPIDKGLNGWRVPLVPATRPDVLKDVRTADDLGRLWAGQQFDWPDTMILRTNGLQVVPTTNYTSLFRMLGADRFDYLPRSVLEILPEAERHRHEGIAIDRHIVLRYPAAVYYFVHRDNEKLANIIRAGLEAAIADGSFERLFQAHYGGMIERLALPRRRVIEIANPQLPPETPLARRELWFQPMPPRPAGRSRP